VQFLVSGEDKRNKRDYFASLIAKVLTSSFVYLPYYFSFFCNLWIFNVQHKAPTFDLAHPLHATYLSRNPEMHSKRFAHEDYDYMTSGWVCTHPCSDKRTLKYMVHVIV
jgi:hypothetical protein